MNKRGIGILLILTTAIALGALVQDYRFDGWIAAEREAAAPLDRNTSTSGELSNLNLNDEAAVAARAELRQTIDRRILQLSRLRLAMNGVALIFALAVAVYFGRVVTVLQVRGGPTTAQMLRDLPPPVKTGAPVHAGPGGPGGPVGPSGPGPVGPAGPARNLAAAAELCVDLARVTEAAEIPALLERTATVLGARGLVLWAADPDGARLRPSLSHGYSDKVLAKLRPIQMDSDNVTALAFRSLQAQAQNGAAAGDPAAIAIPLLTASGCVGVMAAELRQNRPHADLLPVARILGAQFSTLIAPAEAEGRRSAHA